MKLQIKNFQGHENSLMEFSGGGINAIIGPTGNGKSSIFRAMEALVLGKIMDRRHKTTSTSINLDGCSRIYEGGKGKYKVDDHEFAAMRKSVPGEVFDKLRLRDINFRSQHQPYFLLSDSPGAVARAMNELTDLGIIDYVASALKSKGANIEQERSSVSKIIEAEKAKADGLEWAVAADAEYRVIECSQEATLSLTDKAETLSKVITQVIALHEKLSKIPDVSLPIEKLKAALAAVNKPRDILGIQSLLSRIMQYQDFIQVTPSPTRDTVHLQTMLKNLTVIPEAKLVERNISRTVELRVKFEALEFIHQCQKDLSGIQQEYSRYNQINTASEQLASNVLAIRKLASVLSEVGERTTACKKELESLFKVAGQCPFCGSKV